MALMTEHLTEALRAVLDAARAWRATVADPPFDPVERATEERLIDAIDALEALLARARAATEARAPWRLVLAGDQVQLKSGAWVPVLERWTRPRRGIEVRVELPPVDPNDPDSAPTRKTFLVQPHADVMRRPGEDAEAVKLLTEALGAIVIMSGESAW
jgi:hypothetical protein